MTQPTARFSTFNPHVSVDCVVIGFDGQQIKVLLVKRSEEQSGDVFDDMKLPGSLIYSDEDLDDAALRVLQEFTGIKEINLMQFKAFGAKDRTKNPKDRRWLARVHQQQIDRIITIGYLALVKMDRKICFISDEYQACWIPLSETNHLALDHTQILGAAMAHIRTYLDLNPSLLFDLLPRKFTALELRVLCELLYNKPLDVRNFHKRIANMPYVIPLEERQQGVSHRAARYYRFDKKSYTKTLNHTHNGL